MSEFIVKVIRVANMTHDVKQFVVERPQGYKFVPGQATEVAVNKPGWKNEKRPFTFTGSPNDSDNLEFVIKLYSSHNGVTNEFGRIKSGDELIIHDVWGAIEYKGKGVFIAGGSGITPFIAIFRQLYKDNLIEDNKLIFSNKTSADIIMKTEFEKMLGSNFINVLTQEINPGIYNKRIDKDYLNSIIENFNQHFYVCGPEKFTESVVDALVKAGAEADAVVTEK